MANAENKCSQAFDVAVIGAGIIGTSIAERLQFEGKRVVLIDRDLPGSGCSKGNAGHFGADMVLPLANLDTLLSVPKMLADPQGPLTLRWPYLPKLMPWLLRFAWSAMPHKSEQSIRALKALNRPSIERYGVLLKRLQLESLMQQQGAMTIFQSVKSQGKIARHQQLMQQHKVEVELLDGDAVRELEPALADSVVGGLYYPKTAHCINPHRLVTELARCFQQAGGQFVQTTVKGFDFQGDKAVKIQGIEQSLSAEKIVIACGAYSKQLVSQLGHKVPLETERGYHLMLPEAGVNLQRPIVSFERSFAITPMEEGIRLAGTVELAGLDAEENWRRSDILFQHASHILPGLNRHNATRWMGRRPSLPDSLPVIDQSTHRRNVYFAFGHQHLGLTQAAVTADWLSDLIFERGNLVDMSAYGIDRF